MAESVLVVGAGYVGLTCAAAFAQLGHRVTAFDIDEAKMDRLNVAEIPIHEPGLDDMVRAGLEAGLLRFTVEPNAIDGAEIVYLCLPTPAKPSGTPDTSALRSVLMDHGARFAPSAIVVTKSTVPLGTADHIAAWSGRDDLRFVSNPEFLREGHAVNDFMQPDRLVIGANDAATAERIAALHGEIRGELILTDPLSAELIKYASNAFLATKLSFVNELARLCDELGGDVDAVVNGLGTDHRIADAFLTPGPGWGGSCFPKDVAGLAELARSKRLRVPVIESANESNRDHFDHLVGRVVELVDRPLGDARIAFWGLAFKAGTDDTRSSPALELLERLSSLGATIAAHDPIAALPDEMVAQAGLYEVCADADVLVVLTEWAEFAQADLAPVAAAMRGNAVLDLRGIIEPARAEAAGISLHRLGRPSITT